tara:strand:+ start:987 stop:1130 length:144 start_codon:yes stop_codon:yes gene_type:complete
MRFLVGAIKLSLAVGHEHSQYLGWCVLGVGLIISGYIKSQIFDSEEG